MFVITERKINVEACREQLVSPGAGAYVSFEGRVRNRNEGLWVESLEYEVYESLAHNEMKKIFEELEKKYNVLQYACVHRSGHLTIGDVAVWIGVIASHRLEAFEVCRFIIDELKQRVPIWKKEFYRDKTSAWIACHRCSGSMLG